MNNKNKYQRWFVFDCYTPAGRPKMEDALMNWAAKKWLHCTIYEHDLKDMVKALNNKQDRLHEENKRLKRVDIKLNHTSLFPDIQTLWIGSQNLRLKRVREELEYVEFVSV